MAQEILDRCPSYNDDQKLGFFHNLANDLGIDADHLKSALASYQRDPSKQCCRVFMQASEPPRQEVIRRLDQVSGATHILVNMCADLL